ncbi:MAG: ammonium transporter [Anaerolineaceae bacterium]|nr:ammonium transporter [Anaerolineaceae bacterium]
MKYRHKRFWLRLLAIGIGVLFLAAMSTASFAQDEAPAEEAAVEEVVEDALTAETVQTNLDQTWILLAGFLVFFMQAGFAMLEGGFIRATGVVNSMAENFMDAAITGIVFFLVGYGIAFASTDGGGFFGTPVLALGGITGVGEGDGITFVGFFFQFAFAGAAATIATGAMAERTDFRGKILYSAIIALIIYPLVVFWTWGGGWLAAMGFLDFAGSTVVHQTGGFIALVGAFIVGPRVGRVFGKPPAPSNLMLATLGTFVLWFGWYGFNVGSTLGASDVNALGLVAVNTTLAACMGAVAAMFFAYFTKGGKWDLGLILNGSLAGLVGITAGCAFVSPISSLIIGLIAGIVVVLVVNIVEAAKIDDAVGAFAVHGACGMWGTLAIGLFAIPELTGGSAGLLAGGGVAQLITQATGVIAVAVWATVTSAIMFSVLKAVGVLRMPAKADEIGIDVYEHGAVVMPDLLPMTDGPIAGTDTLSKGTSPAVGD